MNRKIRISNITWDEFNDEVNSLNCPICDKVWIKDGAEYDPSIVKACKHLRFRLIDNYAVEWFGRWNHEGFEKAYTKSYLEVYNDPDLEEDDITFCEIDDYTIKALENMDADTIDEVFVLEEEGLACGPVRLTILYGIKHDESH